MCFDGCLVSISVVEEKLSSLGDVGLGSQYQPRLVVYHDGLGTQVCIASSMVDETSKPWFSRLLSSVDTPRAAIYVEKVHVTAFASVLGVLLFTVLGIVDVHQFSSVLHNKLVLFKGTSGVDSASFSVAENDEIRGVNVSARTSSQLKG